MYHNGRFVCISQVLEKLLVKYYGVGDLLALKNLSHVVSLGDALSTIELCIYRKLTRACMKKLIPDVLHEYIEINENQCLRFWVDHMPKDKIRFWIKKYMIFTLSNQTALNDHRSIELFYQNKI